MDFKLFICCVCFSAQGILVSQEDTVKVDEVIFSNSRLANYTVGAKYVVLDSLDLPFQNLAVALQNIGGVFVKSYGGGSLATTSIRGGNGSQTAVLWNGLPISSSMNGITDFSLIPSSLFNEIGVEFGGTSSAWGSGGFGGAVHLNNTTSFGAGLKVGAGAQLGSFGVHTQKVQVSSSSKKQVFSVSLSNDAAKNNFTYDKSFAGKDSTITRKHSDYNSFGVLGKYKRKLKSNQFLEVLIWYQKSSREIAPSLSQEESRASQEDEVLRSSLSWKSIQSKNTIQIKVAHFLEKIDYTDSLTSIFANNVANSIFAEISVKRKFSKVLTGNFGAMNTHTKAETDNYLTVVGENRLAMFALLKHNLLKGKLSYVLSSRGEMVNTKSIVPTASAQLKGVLTSWLSVKMKIGSLYRYPTINDLHWNPGGNVDLLPEKGYSGEAGLVFSKNTKKMILSSEITWFNKRVNDWIAWVPSGNYWVPQNVNKVWSRGLESRSKVQFMKKNTCISAGLNTNYVLSTNESESALGNSYQKQLIYVPRYTGAAWLSFGYKKTQLKYQHSYTGYSFTSSDNTEYIPPFDIASLGLYYNASKGKYIIRSFFKIENLWGTQYQRLANYPMPRVSYNIGVQIAFKKALKVKESLKD